MASKTKSPRIPTAPLNSILQPLTHALRQSCRRGDLAMNEVDQTSASRALYALTGTGAVVARTDRKCILNQLFPKTNPELWLGVLLELRKQPTQNEYEVVHVSIQAFEGATSQTVQPLLRAEWDPTISRSKHGTAQPHWHAYARVSAVREHRFAQEGLEEFGEKIEQFESIKQRQHKVHFALCANWHKGGSHFEVLSTPDELRGWVLGVLDYIKSQV